MFFTPVIRRAAYTHAPRSADLALQRFLMGTLGATAGGSGQPAGYTVTQDDKHTTLQLDVPGLSREQLNIAPWKSWLPLIVLVWVVRRWLQIVLADASVGGGFFNGLLNNPSMDHQVVEPAPGSLSFSRFPQTPMLASPSRGQCGSSRPLGGWRNSCFACRAPVPRQRGLQGADSEECNSSAQEHPSLRAPG